jgi:hypothetical protein
MMGILLKLADLLIYPGKQEARSTSRSQILLESGYPFVKLWMLD